MMTNSDSPLIIMGCDELYCFPLSVAMFSALQGAGQPLRVLVLSDGISAEKKQRLRQIAQRGGAKSFGTLDVDLTEFRKLNAGMPHLSPAAFSRILIPSLLPDEPRCLWVDSDVLVRCDLVKLWNEDLKGKPAGAVQCYYVPSLGSKFGIPYVEGVSENPSVPYLNSGIMVFDLDLWRKNQLDVDVNKFLQRYGKQLVAGDQDILNSVLIGRWQQLPGYWNDQEAANNKARSYRPAAEPHIRHFSGPQKPWNSGLIDRDCKDWLNCAKETGYYSPLQFFLWRLRRLKKVLHGTTINFLKRRGWMQ